MDLSKFKVGSKWKYKGGVLTVGFSDDGFCVLKNTLGEIEIIKDFFPSEFEPYEEPKPDWKEKYPVGSKWVDSEGTLAQVIAHTKKDEINEDAVFFSTKLTGVLNTFFINSVMEALTPYKEPASGTFWGSIYKGKNGFHIPALYPTKDEANAMSHSDRLACVEVSWTEGQGL